MAIVTSFLVLLYVLSTLAKGNENFQNELYSHKLPNLELAKNKNEKALSFDDVLKTYAKEGYTILLASYDDIKGNSNYVNKKLSRLGGIKVDSLKFRDSYAAVIENGAIVKEKRSSDSLVSIIHHNFRINSIGYAKKNNIGSSAGITYVEDVTNNVIDITQKLNRGLYVLAYRHDEGFIKETILYHFDLFSDENLRSIGLKQISSVKENRLSIEIDESDFNKIKRKRKEALDLGLLLSEDDDWVSAKIDYGGKEFKAEIRLKGDWTDHLSHENKWSYKVKLDNGTIFGTNKFSVQTVVARNYMGEWMFHELLKKGNIIALRYNFLPVTVFVKGNNAESSILNNVGLMAFEEGFTKYLLENNNRKESVILKIDESIGWEDFKKGGRSFANESLPISAFELNKILKDSTKYNQFLQARDLLHSYVVGKNVPASSVFDLDKFAYWDAVGTYTAGTHGHALHNQRFYYNPTTNLLEPIGFDALGYFKAKEPFQVQYSFPEDQDYRNLVQKNLHDLMQISYTDIEQIFLQENYLEASNLVAREYPEKVGELQNTMRERHQQLKGIYSLNHPMDIYLEKINKSHAVLNFRSVSKLDIQILGLKYKKKNLVELSKPLLVKEGAFIKDSLEVFEGALNAFFAKSTKTIDKSKFQHLTIQYRYVGTEEVKSKKVIPYPYFDKNYAQKDIMQIEMDFSKFPFLKIDEPNKKIFFVKRDLPWNLSEPLRINKGYKVIVQAGFEIDIGVGGFIISKSPVFFNGEEDSPINIFSSSGKGAGLVVLQNDEISQVKSTVFDGLGNPSYGKWSVTGAITFYESPVEMHDVSIKNNFCEDALNIVRSNFSMDSISFYNTRSDAFDGDFVTGVINHSFFENLGNDGIDVSGSEITLNNVKIKGAGDKAISIGENSRAEISQTVIIDSEIGVNTKDLSTTQINGLEIKNTRLAFTAFQKKEEYGAGRIIASNVAPTEVDELYLIEENSYMSLNGKEILKKIKGVKDKMYGNEYGRKSER